MQAAQRLDDILARAPQSDAVDLSRLHVDDVAPLLPRLAQLRQLRRLDLSGNVLAHLPHDMGLALPALAVLNISGNRFRPSSVNDILPALLSLPGLENLTLTASEEEEESVVVALPDLLELNGTPLTLPEEEEEQAVGRQLPPYSSPQQPVSSSSSSSSSAGNSQLLGMADLQQPSASKNFSPGVSAPHSFGLQPSPGQGGLDGGMSLLPPVHASPSAPMNASGGSNQTAGGMGPGVAAAGPSSSATGGSFSVHSDHGAHQQAVRGAEVAMSGADLEAVSQLFGSIATLRAGLEPGAEQTLQERYERHTQSTLHGLDQQLQHITDPFLKQGEILRAKHQLYEVCFGETIAMIAPTAPAFGEVLRRLRRVHTTLFEEVPAVIRAAVPAREAELDTLRRDVGRAEDETRQLLAAAELLEHEAETHASEQIKLRAAHEETLKENARLRRGEKELQAQLRRARAEKKEASGGGGRKGAYEAGLSLGPGANGGVVKGGGSATQGAGCQNGGSEVAVATQGSNAAPSAPQPQTVRAISLKQLKDHIELIYASKVKFDHKCALAHLPRETMEQHMYTYLNQRYGLKPLIVDHASAIIKAVNKCAPQDNDVAVFGKILRNEVDEEFRFVQQQLKQTVRDLLRVYLKGKFPLKGDREVGRILEARTKGDVAEEEWTDIIKYMYNHQDALSLIVMVKDLCRQRAKSAGHEPSAAATRGARGGRMAAGARQRGEVSMSIPYALLMKV